MEMQEPRDKEVEELYKEGAELVDVVRIEDGEKKLKEVLEKDPNHAPALNKMGVIYAIRKDKDKAAEYFRESLQQDRENAPALTNLGNIFLEQGNYNQAEALYLDALKYDPDYGPAHNNMAAIYKKRGDLKKMVDSMKKARKSGSLSVQSSEKSIFLHPGCLMILAFFAGMLILSFFLSRGG